MWNPFRPFKDIDDSFFSKLIEIDFSKDLEFAVQLTSIPEEKRNEVVNSCLNDLRQKYSSKNPQYNHASKKLRNRYDNIEREINLVLYPN